MDKKYVKETALANGFKLKNQSYTGIEWDLNPYVYDFADALCSQLEQERDQLKNELKDIENLPPAFKNAKPAENYKGLLKQFNSMKGWANSQQKQVKFYREKDCQHSKELMLSNAENINSLRDENEQLTNLLLAAENSVPDIQAKAIEDFQTYFDKEYYGEELSQFIEQYAEKKRQQAAISE